MDQIAQISFAIQPFEGAFAVVPLINNAPLSELIRSFESARGYEPAGGYGGLVPQRCNYGPLDRYFLGNLDMDSRFGRLGCVYLLECTCGESECWPLAARVKVGLETVVWDSFQQPHRPKRNYSDFGPFVFKLPEYRHAAIDLQAEITARLRNTGSPA